MFEQVDRLADDIRQGITREDLQELLPAGGARNAVDCALWDLECKKTGKTIWQLTGIDPKPVTTVFTIGLEATPEGRQMLDRLARIVNQWQRTQLRSSR